MKNVDMTPTLNFTTPVGDAVWPQLQVPNTHFKPEGTYDCRITLSAEDSAVIITKLKNLLAENLKFHQELEDVASARNAKGKKSGVIRKSASRPWSPEVDDTGAETGRFTFRTKAKASYKAKDGSTVHMRIKLFNSDGSLLEEGARQLHSGTKLRLAVEARGYCVQKEAGVSLKLLAAQIITPVYRSKAAKDFGFDTAADRSLDAIQDTDAEMTVEGGDVEDY